MKSGALQNLKEEYNGLYLKGYRRDIKSYEFARWKALNHFITKVLKLKNVSTFLDYGCGSGLYIKLWKQLFPQAELYFCDVSTVALDRLIEKYPEFKERSAIVKNNMAGFKDNFFDVIVSIEVMEHVEDVTDYLRDIHRLLKTGGSFIWTTPCANRFSIEYIFNIITGQFDMSPAGERRWKWEDPRHLRRLKSRELKIKLQSTGFTGICFRFRAHIFSSICSCLFRGRFQKLGERIMLLDYMLFRRLPNAASMIGSAIKRSEPIFAHPREINFLMIEKCISKCIMCGGKYYNGDPERRITLGSYKKILAHLRMEKVDYITYGGLGEPLLNPDIKKIILYTSEKFPHVKKKIITNGILLEKDMVNFLVKYISVFNISIHAIKKDTHRRITQTEYFDRIVENIKYLSKKRERKKCRIFLFMAISRINISEVPGMVNFAYENGCDGVITWYCRIYPESKRFKPYDRVENRLRETESLYFSQEESDRYIKEAKVMAQKRGISFYHEPLFGEKFRPRWCCFPWESIFVGPEGEIYPCAGAEVLFEERIRRGIYQSGNLIHQRIEEIWNNEFYRKLRASCRGREYYVPECRYCGNCIRWEGPLVKKSHILEWPE